MLTVKSVNAGQICAPYKTQELHRNSVGGKIQISHIHCTCNMQTQ